jgi:hypothetical protein
MLLILNYPVRNGIWVDTYVDGPDILRSLTRRQPKSSRAAMEAFQRICDDDVMSITSREAAWGTYRTNSPSISESDGERVSTVGPGPEAQETQRQTDDTKPLPDDAIEEGSIVI